VTNHWDIWARYTTELEPVEERSACDEETRDAFRAAAEGRQKSVDRRRNQRLGRLPHTRQPILNSEGCMEPPATALVVEPSVPETLFLVSSLSDLGFRVTLTDNFTDARAGLMSAPTLLVTELRLGEYNGLHLVFRAKSIRSDMAAIIRTQIADPLLQLEAERMGATFVLKTTNPEEFRAAVARTLLRRTDSFEPIRPPFERRHRERRGAHAALDKMSERRVGERRVDIRKTIRERSST
jgi:DNA-binding response OmpR family regulator